jgi:predicted transposase/invertase (TIGR01784 family)
MFDEDERQIYELRWKTYTDEASRLDSALHKGLTQGREEGLEQGERAKAVAVARQLLAMGMPAAQISLATGLSEAEIGLLAAG